MPELVMIALPPLEVPKKPTTEPGKAPEPVLLIRALPAVEASRKLTNPVALVLLIVAEPAVAVSKKFVMLNEPVLLIVALPAVD